MTGASDKAVEAAAKHPPGQGCGQVDHATCVEVARTNADRMHDPALGRDASVNLGTVLDAFDRWYAPNGPGDTELIGFEPWLEREHREGRL